MRLRNTFIAAVSLIFASVLAASGARSESYRPDITVGPAISSLGLGGDVGVRFNDFIGLRVVGNAWLAEFDASYGDIDYGIDFTLASVGPMLDVYPFGRILRFTAGFRYNMNGIGLDATPNTNIVVGGTSYTPAQIGKIEGDIDFNAFSPYVGLGLEASFGMLSLGLEGGVLFQGAPSVSLRNNGSLASDPTFRADLKREEQQIEDDLAFLAYYPVVSLYMTFRF